MNIRHSLKSAIDTWPEPVLFAVQEFALFETQRLQASAVDHSEADIERGRAALKHLKKYFGTIHREIDYKQELLEALDEKYNRTS
ncbi:MAG: hypothetical protein LBS97_06115 [Treponema sp.]|nr:hypothetical protein [Treponema sp.]